MLDPQPSTYANHPLQRLSKDQLIGLIHQTPTALGVLAQLVVDTAQERDKAQALAAEAQALIKSVEDHLRRRGRPPFTPNEAGADSAASLNARQPPREQAEDHDHIVVVLHRL